MRRKGHFHSLGPKLQFIFCYWRLKLLHELQVQLQAGNSLMKPSWTGAFQRGQTILETGFLCGMEGTEG